MANKKQPQKKQSRSSSGISLNKVAFYTFVIAAFVLMIQAILARVLPDLAGVMAIIAAIIQIVLYTIAGILAFRYIRGKQPVWIALFVLACLVLIVAVVLPLF